MCYSPIFLPGLVGGKRRVIRPARITASSTQSQQGVAMKSAIPLWLPVLLAAAIVCGPDDALAKKTYHVDGLEIEATTNADGSLQVVEERLYRFRGRFKYAYRTFSRAGGIDYSGFEVRENGTPNEPVRRERWKNPPAQLSTGAHTPIHPNARATECCIAAFS